MCPRNVTVHSLINRLWFRILVILAVFVMLMTLVSNMYPTSKVETLNSLEKFTAHLDDYIPALMQDYSIPGVSIALIQEGQTVWSNAYGYADIETERSMTTDTYCRVESISKSVTAWAIMKLVEQGLVELDRPVKEYIKSWEFPKSDFSVDQVTVRELLSHTSGMPLGDIFERYSPEVKIPSLKESLTKQAIPIQEPGRSFVYSNTGYNLLELLIEEVTGRDFAAFMEEEVLVPLKMHNSSFTWSGDLTPPVPVGYGLKGRPIPVYVYPEKASGGLFATVGDIAAFVSAGMYRFVEQSVLTSESIDKLYTPAVEDIGVYSLIFDGYGLGYYFEELSNGRLSVANGGQGGGVMTFFQAVPETGDGIVILTNSQRSWPFFALLLTDWARWNGADSIGMGKIVIAQKALWILIGMLWFSVVYQVLRLVLGCIAGKRFFTPSWKKFELFRLIQGITAIVLLAGVLWCNSQDYLFISAVFPVVSGWLGLAVLFLALALLCSALCPRKGNL